MNHYLLNFWLLLAALLTPVYSAAITANFPSATNVAVTAASYVATGNTVELSIGFVPPTGTSLTVVKNTGLAFIVGRFNNLAQGQTVNLFYKGKSYRFVANYYGGTGNDLVLQWPYRELVSWGDNGSGQLGNGGTTNNIVPGLVLQSGVLAGKTVVAVASGYLHNIALCSDGTLAAWGDNSSGQLGNNSTTNSSVPVLVDQNGVLAGKIVTSIAAGSYYNLALCSDGTLAAWGDNSSGQLGNNSTTSSSVPVLVTQSGVLTDKTVVSVVAGNHNFALCSDNTLAAWGGNYYGQLGNSSTTGSSVPVLVTRSGVLAGKTVVSLTAGYGYSLALCSDGTLAAWGYNLYGQLGNNSTTSSADPILVTQSGVLGGKTVVSVAAGYFHSLALCSDGTLAAWGYGIGGQLDFFGIPYSIEPVLVTQSGVLAGKTVTSVTAGFMHSFALCSDGTVAAWGDNNYGQLGNGGTNSGISRVPVLVTQNGVLAGKTVTSMAAGYTQSLALCSDGTLATWGENGYGQLGNGGTSTSLVPGRVTQSGVMVGKTVVFVAAGVFHNLVLCSDGTLVAWGDNLHGQLGTDDTINRNVPVLVTQSGVLAGKSVVSMAAGEDHSLALCSDGTLVAWGDNLHGQLGTNDTSSSNVPVLVTQSGVLAGKSVVSLAAGSRYSLVLCSDGTLAAWGSNQFGQLGNNSTTESSVPVLVNQSGVLADKTVTSIAAGSFHSLALCSDGRLAAWGKNRNGQLGKFGNTDSSMPVWVDNFSTFPLKTVVSVAASGDQSLSLYSDATLATWGVTISGQRPVFGGTIRNRPVGVTRNGVLTGKTVTSIAAGSLHNLALCSDGTLVAWGFNFMGQLGNDSTTTNSVPVLVTQGGVMAGKIVASIAAGSSHSLALANVQNPSALSGLVLSNGPLSPAFHPNTTSFAAAVSNGTASVKLRPTVADDTATINVNETAVASGTDSNPVPLSVGTNTITTTVTASDGTQTSYTITVTRAGGIFETWKEAVFTDLLDRTNPAISGEMATPANDGITNLMKYSLALPPKVDGSGDLPTLAIQNGFRTLTYRKNKLATDVIFTVEACDSLTEGAWLPITNLISQADMGDYWSITVRDNQTQTSSPKRFMRLRVEK